MTLPTYSLLIFGPWAGMNVPVWFLNLVYSVRNRLITDFFIKNFEIGQTKRAFGIEQFWKQWKAAFEG